MENNQRPGYDQIADYMNKMMGQRTTEDMNKMMAQGSNIGQGGNMGQGGDMGQGGNMGQGGDMGQGGNMGQGGDFGQGKYMFSEGYSPPKSDYSGNRYSADDRYNRNSMMKAPPGVQPNYYGGKNIPMESTDLGNGNGMKITPNQRGRMEMPAGRVGLPVSPSDMNKPINAGYINSPVKSVRPVKAGIINSPVKSMRPVKAGRIGSPLVGGVVSPGKGAHPSLPIKPLNGVGAPVKPSNHRTLPMASHIRNTNIVPNKPKSTVDSQTSSLGSETTSVNVKPYQNRLQIKAKPASKKPEQSHSEGEFMQDFSNGQLKKRTILQRTDDMVKYLRSHHKVNTPQRPGRRKRKVKRSHNGQRSSKRRKRHVGPHDEGGLQRLISTGI